MSDTSSTTQSDMSGRKKRVVGPKGRKDRYVGAMEAQLKLWAAQATIECRQSIDDLKAKCAVTHAKVKEFKAAGSEKWEGFKAGIERAWSDLDVAFGDLNL